MPDFLTPFGPMSTPDESVADTWRSVEQQGHRREQQANEIRRQGVRSVEAQFAEGQHKLDDARTQNNQLENKIQQLEMENERLEVEKASYRKAAINILRNRKAAYNTMARMAKAWGKPLVDPENDPEFEAAREQEKVRLESDRKVQLELEQHVDRSAAHALPACAAEAETRAQPRRRGR